MFRMAESAREVLGKITAPADHYQMKFAGQHCPPATVLFPLESTAASSHTDELPIRTGCGALSGKVLGMMFGEGPRVARLAWRWA